jgi:[acyl-carrier-protein] S-malonyltransferase
MSPDRRFAFIYPGQGSQFVGMAGDIREAGGGPARIFDIAEEVMGAGWSSVFLQGPEEDLKQTINTQPAVIVHSVGLTDALRMRGIEPVIVAGHSLGEYTSTYGAGAMEARPLLQLVKLRAELMQQAGTISPGGMAAIIGMDDDKLAAMCRENGRVFVANFNAPGQTVIAGYNDAIPEFMEQCKAAGAKRALPVPVSGAFHSPLMKPASEQLEPTLRAAEIIAPRVPIAMNVDGAVVSDPEEIRERLHLQMTSSVRWIDCVKSILAYGVDAMIEVGPGKILSGLVKRIDKDIPVYNVVSLADIDAVVAGG